MVRRMEKLARMRTRCTVSLLVVLLAVAMCTGARAEVRGSGTDLLKKLDAAFIELWEHVAPAVVNVDTEREITVLQWAPFFRDFFREQRFPEREPKKKVQGRGSGFVIGEEGYVLTSFHVIEGADTIKVRFSEEKVYDAKIVGADRGTDIALIKIEAENSLPAVTLGDSDALRVGQLVMAIGNPGGTLPRTFTVGHVSGLGRVLPGFAGRMRYGWRSFIQTDAAINRGNSGGPLINVEGEVVGINAAMAAPAENIGFAVPINLAKEIIPDLKREGRVIRGFLGVSAGVLAPDVAPGQLAPGVGEEVYGVPDDKGALVGGVVEGSPAEKAGLTRYDVITEVEGQKIESWDELIRVVGGFRPGTTVRVKYVRNRKERIATVKLAELPDRETEETLSTGARPEESLGMTVADITRESAGVLGLEIDKGVIVVEVDPGSPAAERGVEPKDVILEVNRQPVNDVQEFRKVVGEVELDDWIVLLLNRDEQTLIVHIKKPEPSE